MVNLDLYVMTHKKIEDKRIPKDRTMMLVGAYNKELNEYLRDDSNSDNISNKNSSFCELTGLYHIWKHSNAKYVGLEHYRRFFSDGLLNLFGYKIISKKKIEKLLDKYDIILPKKHCWPNYKSLYEQFTTEHIKDDFDKLEGLVKAEYPDYADAWDKAIHQTNWAFNYNMFVCKKELIDNYCEWLFDVLFKLENQIDLNDGRDDYQKRLFGFLSERLFNVWIVKQNALRIKELKLASLGDSNIHDFKRRVYRFFKWRKCLKNRGV